MDSNNFKKSQNFDNLESNKANNPNMDQNPTQFAQDYLKEMRSKKEEATREGYMDRAKQQCPPDSWTDKEKEYDDAWEQNKDFQLGE